MGIAHQQRLSTPQMVGNAHPTKPRSALKDTYLKDSRVGAGHARDLEQKNKKVQMHANKNKIFFFYLRSFAFSVSFNVGRGHGPLLQLL